MRRALALLVLVAACSTNGADTPKAAPVATNAATNAATTTTTVKRIDYKAQYLRLITAPNAALDKYNAATAKLGANAPIADYKARAKVDKVARRIERVLRAEPRVAGGGWLLSGVLDPDLHVRDIDIDALVADAIDRGVVPIESSTALELKLIKRDAPLQVYPMVASAAFMEGPDNADRLAEALRRKAKPLARAGAAGYETHLVLLQWALGSTEHWRRLLDENPIESTHPQYLWVIDFFPRASLTCLSAPTASQLGR